MEIKRSALLRLAISALWWSGMNTSVLRVYITFTLEQLFSTNRPKASATLRLIFFSLEKAPIAPASCPPCPGSMTSVTFFLAAMATTSTNIIIIVATILLFIYTLLYLECKISNKYWHFGQNGVIFIIY